MRYKKGDTLIEVTLAIGIFSMIAIAIVAVMSNGNSSAQSALETTLAREAIDSQAEALRFIHSAYVASKPTDKDGTGNYALLWKTITDHANDLSRSSVDKTTLLNYAPATCSSLYPKKPEDDSIITDQKAFVIDPHSLGKYSNMTPEQATSGLNEVYISAGSSKLIPANIYPRLVFSSTDDPDLTAEDVSKPLYRAEGIYVVAVRDSGTTNIVNDATVSPTSTASAASAFYDFYIRTCWYGSNANEPSTIATVIRLYDPAIIKTTTTEP